MKILKILGLILAIFLVVVAIQPDDYRVERSLVMKASPATIFAQVNDLTKWAAWSPWEKLDPTMKKTFAGPRSGKGAKVTWEGNAQAGSGSMEIVESKPSSSITYNLHFIKPMEGDATSEFTFAPTAGGTNVTWVMYGKNNFIGKAVGLIMNCKKMIGDAHAEGLAKLKEVVKG